MMVLLERGIIERSLDTTKQAFDTVVLIGEDSTDVERTDIAIHGITPVGDSPPKRAMRVLLLVLAGLLVIGFELLDQRFNATVEQCSQVQEAIEKVAKDLLDGIHGDLHCSFEHKKERYSPSSRGGTYGYVEESL